jgi:signal transduction histidine kinase/PAS domain-containing protein
MLPVALATTIAPSLIAHKLAGDTLRVWIPGCATGEVAYAITTMLQEKVEQRSDPPSIQIFATDSDARAIATARRGRYPKKLASALSPNWRQYFLQEDQHYHVLMRVRDLITFAQHELLRDPPFAHMDLIVCADRLSSFSSDDQQQLLHVFHWSLRPRGYLVLNAEDAGASLSQLFVAHDAAGVFQRRGTLPTAPPVPRDVPQIERRATQPLQLVNEQLQAMNQALRGKVGDLTQANDDLINLLSATDLATIFLDRKLQIARFTRQAQSLFNLTLADRGRPFAHITHTLDYDQMLDDAGSVLGSLQTIEREIRGADGRWYLARLCPYRTTDERVDGVVLVCMDITPRVIAEAEIRRARDELELRVRERTEELSTANTQLQVEIAERTHLEQERIELLRKLVMTQEDERRRIARELHDQLSQSVTALGLGLGILANPAIAVAQRQQGLAHLQQIVAQIDQDIHRMAIDLRPTALDDLGLIPALRHYVERWTEQSGIRAEFQTIGLEAARLPRELESVVYRLIQEALTNVLKHAQAKQVSVILERHQDQLRVIVEDDGRGFDLDALEQAANVQQRLGLLGMRERVALVGGTLTIETALGAGTTLFVQLPIPPEAAELTP